MKAWVYVEGPGDRLALEALWADWRSRLGDCGHGLSIIPLEGKAKFLRKIGDRAAQNLAGSSTDVVVGLPDLYPTREYDGTDFTHQDVAELRQLQRRRVYQSLVGTQRVSPRDARLSLERFHPSALKHDLEMLLLAAVEELRERLRTSDRLGDWRHPVEEQDQDRPPKRIVERLFQVKRRYSYRDTLDAPAILRKVSDMRQLLYGPSHQLECPVFREMLDWLGSRYGVPAYA